LRTEWRTGICLGVSILLLAFPLRFWLAIPASDRFFHYPATPTDRTPGIDTAAWVLLWRAKEIIPPGKSIAFTAANRDEALTLYMLSLGVFPRNIDLPVSYYSQTYPESLTSSDYLVALRCSTRPPGARLLASFREGCVWARERP
jgi:hypothetical protein